MTLLFHGIIVSANRFNVIRLSKNSRPRRQRAGFRDRRSGPLSRAIGVLFGLPFLAGGLFFCWIGAAGPLLQVWSSQNWERVPCTIRTSTLVRHSDSDGTSYRIVIEFDYAFEGLRYSGGRYNFADMASSGRAGKQAILDQYPVGHSTLCWVDPSDPESAVLVRNLPSSVYFILPFSSVFILIGLGVIAASLGLVPEGARAKARKAAEVTHLTGGTTLNPAGGGRFGRLLGALLVCLFWNGITGVFVGIVIKSFIDGSPSWFLALFMIPFVAVGVFLIGGVVHSALALANPRAQLVLSTAQPRLGEPFELSWSLRGKVDRLESFTVTVEGIESATYRRGTDSVTDESVFYREVVHRAERGNISRSGNQRTRIPATFMHSFQARNNRIIWRVQVDGTIRRWPDVQDRYTLSILPR